MATPAPKTAMPAPAMAPTTKPPGVVTLTTGHRLAGGKTLGLKRLSTTRCRVEWSIRRCVHRSSKARQIHQPGTSIRAGP